MNDCIKAHTVIAFILEYKREIELSPSKRVGTLSPKARQPAILIQKCLYRDVIR
jgi:hypothetical protein